MGSRSGRGVLPGGHDREQLLPQAQERGVRLLISDSASSGTATDSDVQRRTTDSNGVACMSGFSTSALSALVRTSDHLVLAIVAGGGLGGAVFSLLSSALIQRLGIPWALRVTSFVYLAIMLPSSLCLKSRMPRTALRGGPIADWSMFRDRRFLWLAAGAFVAVFPLFGKSLPGPYALHESCSYLACLLDSPSVLPAALRLIDRSDTARRQSSPGSVSSRDASRGQQESLTLLASAIPQLASTSPLQSAASAAD